nr:MAG TPA: Thymidylate synthase complementing protein [Caudoviricetes sp.]
MQKVKDIREYSIEEIIYPKTLELRVSMEDFKRWLGVDEERKFGYTLEENKMGTVIITKDTTKYPITMIGRYAGVCWGANTSDNEKNYKRGLDCIESEHGRTWEFPDVYAIIDGYSAKVLREWYTHVGGLPTRLQASTRYINYSKGEGFKYVTPPTIANNNDALAEWSSMMSNINDMISKFINVYNIPVEDATMALPIAYQSKMVDKRNFRNVVDMSNQRTCTRAYWEYRNQLMKDYLHALREYSEEWKTLIDMKCKPKCEKTGFCTEKKTCERKPKRDEK